LAIKKFSWSTASRRIAVRQIRSFARIAALDSQLGFGLAMHRKLPKAYDERLVHARFNRSARDSVGVTPTSDAEFGLEQIVDGLRISLAAG
jgi:hypothetical protein